MAAQTARLTNADLEHQRYIQMRIGRLSLTLASLIGLLAFLAPFWAPIAAQAGSTAQAAARADDSPLITLIISAVCMVVLFANLGPALSSKAVALLGVLIGVNTMLRIVDLSFLPQGEFSPIFLLITLVGYCYGAQMGFLMGALTLLCSAFVTGGIGPWLPFQMMAAGWMGLTASWLRLFGDFSHRPGRAIVLLAVFSFIWGLLYGAILNLYFWPLVAGGGSMYYTQGDALTQTLSHYALFYVVQSLPADLARAAGNVAMILALGLPLLKIFQRFQVRFSYQRVVPIATSSDLLKPDARIQVGIQ